MDRNTKARLMHRARALTHATEKGRAYGVITAKALAVFQALLWGFHNAKGGLCFPSYETIAEAAHCARSAVAEALKALEDAGVLTWVQRVKRVREACPDLLGDEGWRWRVLRTSNSYAFTDSAPAVEQPNPSKSENQLGTQNQAFIPLLVTGAAGPTDPLERHFRAFQPESSPATEPKAPLNRQSQRPSAWNRVSGGKDAR